MKRFFKLTILFLGILFLASLLLDVIYTSILSNSEKRNKVENIIHTKNKKLKNEINRILRLEFMNKWKPSLIGGRINLKGGFEIRYIETKMQMRLILKK